MGNCNCIEENNNLKTLTIVVSGMSCRHCKKAVEEAVKKLAGVNDAKVDLESSLLTVTFDSRKLGLTELQNAIIGAGYEVR